MFGRTFLMELRTGWKGILVLTFLILLVGTGMPGIYPSMQDAMEEDLEGQEKVDLEMPKTEGGNINISWEPNEEAMVYYVVESNKSHLMPVIRNYTTVNNYILVPHDFEEDRYFAVMALTRDNETVFIGMTTTGGVADPFEELLKNPAYSGFTGGRDYISMGDIKGFISFEFFSWWWMLAGLFIAYLSVVSVANDFEGKRMDLIFSTPLSRKQYLLEKFMTMSALSLFVIIISALFLQAGVEAIGMGDELGLDVAFMCMIGALPFLMVIASTGILVAVLFQKSKAGMGFNFIFIIGEYILYSVSSATKSVEDLKYFSIFEYWDYNDVLFDNTFNLGHFSGLFVASLVILVVAMYIFDKRDMPT